MKRNSIWVASNAITGSIFAHATMFSGWNTRLRLQLPKILHAGRLFFAFPVDHVEHLPFPFFVRGDDVSFSLVNDSTLSHCQASHRYRKTSPTKTRR